MPNKMQHHRVVLNSFNQQLGSQVGDKYVIFDQTAEVLDNMNRQLNEEDKMLRTYRRAVYFSKVLQNDLVPILCSSGNNITVFDAVIRLLVNPSVPIKCLCPVELMQSTMNGQQTIFELKNSLTEMKYAFMNPGTARVIMEQLSKYTSNKTVSLDTQEVNTVNGCLLLIRNILHIPDSAGSPNSQNQIIWNLFRLHLDQVLLDSISHVNATHWCTTVVQLIALIYKDQHVANLQDLLRTFISVSLSESSDDESNSSLKHGSCFSMADSSSDNSGPPLKEVGSGEGEASNNQPHKKGTTRQYAEACNEDQTGEPPQKKYLREDGQMVIETKRSPRREKEFGHKQRSRCSKSGDSGVNSDSGAKERLEPSSSSNSDVTGVPKCRKIAEGDRITDIGYFTQQTCADNIQQESTSSSSTEDCQKRNRLSRGHPAKLKAKGRTILTLQEKQRERRLKMLNLSRQQRMRMKAMVNNVPRDEDISELLKEFTIDFLLSEYSHLVGQLLAKEREIKVDLDKSHFLWLITYFLKFASQLEVDLETLDSVLSFNTLAYITYEGVEQLETLELANRQRNADVRPYIRRVHLVVTALREFIQTVTSYKDKPVLSEEDRGRLLKVQLHSAYTKGVRQLLLLLLRSYNSSVYSKQYLKDLVVTNNQVLINLEELSRHQQYQGPPINLSQHLRQFANTELMRQYGHLLLEFRDNSPTVNDCIFTMMHHVAGDLEAPQSLFIPSVLQTFSRILEKGVEICQDWVDLIEYVVQKFIQTMQRTPNQCATTIADCMDSRQTDEFGLTDSQSRKLFFNFNQVENLKDPVGAIIDIYRQTDRVTLSRMAVIQALLSYGIITHAQYMSFMYMKSVLALNDKEQEGSVIVEVGSEHCNSDSHITDGEETQAATSREIKEIKLLKDCLIKQGRESLISWVQDLLLDACRVKMNPFTILPGSSNVPHEPIPFYYNLAKQGIPLVPFSRVQYQGLQTEAFILLLHKLGFLLPADVGKVYPRIPYFWSADHLLSVALKLGPLRADPYRFSVDDVERINKKGTDVTTVLERELKEKLKEENDLEKASKASSQEESTNWFNMAMISKDLLASSPNSSSSARSNDGGVDMLEDSSEMDKDLDGEFPSSPEGRRCSSPGDRMEEI